ncbi:NUDIX domain-containing protein [Streptosporangium sp. NPDC004379]|uniref:NUDIX hydrolase n=1 Tax=Streptosporangium sp. NPDC004379 TaxID=3366189 RepID=UPI0036CD1F67
MTDPDTRPADPIRAAGAVVWRGRESAPEVALVHRPKYGDWTFPKGKLHPGEHVVAGALREVAEETGLALLLGRPLPPVHYLIGGRSKRVDYWTARVAPGVRPVAEREDDEVDEVAWVPAAEAARLLTYEWDTALLDALAAAPLATTPLVLVRHALAGSREKWEGDDDERPIDRDGAAQAAALAGVLPGYLPAELVSSPSRRCVQTLEPYAGRAGLAIRPEPALSESRHDPDTALRLVTGLLSASRPAALCSHGKVLPGLMTGVGVGREEARLPKGGFMVLHHAAGRLVATESHPV